MSIWIFCCESRRVPLTHLQKLYPKNSTEYYVNISVTISKNFSYNAMRVNLALVFSPFSINQTLECLKNKRFVYHESLTFINDVKHIK